MYRLNATFGIVAFCRRPSAWLRRGHLAFAPTTAMAYSDKVGSGKASRPSVSSLGGHNNGPPHDRGGDAVGEEEDGPSHGPHWLWLLLSVPVACLLRIAKAAIEGLQYAHWLANQNRTDGHPTVSLIVPVYNEESCLPVLLEHIHLMDPQPSEVIFVDGGSNDRSKELLAQSGFQVVYSAKGRSMQQNTGALLAKGTYLCFLHADTKPCKDCVNVIRFEMETQKTLAGGFTTHVCHENRGIWWATANLHAKAYYGPLLLRPVAFVNGLRCLFGDECIFLRAADFHAVGGFDESLAIMEDADLLLRMHQHARQNRYGARVRRVEYRKNETSGRRMVTWGPWITTWKHIRIGLGWYFGMSAEQLQTLYDKEYGDIR